MTAHQEIEFDRVSSIKRAVIDAGIRLVKEGLIVKTSGNISIRIDDDHMAITPSGLPYHRISEDDIVVVNIHDLSYENKNKPSEEKMIHAGLYVADKNTQAVIHTHQTAASIIASTRKPLPVTKPEWVRILGGTEIKCAPYGLPGTGKLKKGVLKAVKGRNAGFFANHGVIFTGRSIEEAFEVSKTLEIAAQHYIDESFEKAVAKANGPQSKQAFYVSNYC